MSVEARKDRIDWRLSHDPKNLSGELPIIGPYETLAERFRQVMLGWLSLCPQISRLAYGAVLLMPAGEPSQACQILEPLLPGIKIDWDNSYDFLYRINRRRRSSSGVEGLEINRVATWSLATISGMRVDFVSGQPAPSIIQLPDSGICRLELDINTAPEFQRVLEKSVRSNLFAELVDFGNEIAREGDIP